MDHIEYIKSNKGGVKIIYRGFMYTVHKERTCGGIRWRCAHRRFNCKGSISTSSSGNPYGFIPHSHLPDYQSIKTARNKFEDNNDGEFVYKLLPVITMAGLNNMADFGKKMRKSNFSPEEVETLVRTVGKNYRILYGQFAKRATNKQARHKAWLDVTRQVNRVSIEKRTLQEVKNKWKKCQHLYKDEDTLDDFELLNVLEPLTAFQDSMPLEQRLKTPLEEPVLQSQPLSPTKLKVTRQSTKPPQPSPKAIPPEPPNEEVCLRWNSHHSNMQTSFPCLLMKEQYVDATLVAEGQSLKCHRLILSSCSPYFEEVLSGISPFQHPVLFMKDIPFWVLKSLCDFMYAGEVHIFQNKLEELLAVAEQLKIKGLAGKTETNPEELKVSEPSKPAKEEKRDERELREKKRNPQYIEPSPRTGLKPLRSASLPKKPERTVKEPLSKEGILDPLDLLEPVYEEVTQESAPVKPKEVKSFPMKKGKLKKRKITEEREESPPPLFLSRKGTRSRPNVKIPKYYHTHYEPVSESTIVREPHTSQDDPLLPVEEIKAEPLDLDDSIIEIEDNVIDFSDVTELTTHDEEIIGNYDSPLVNLNKDKEENAATFNKISLVPQPIIMNIHSIAEKPPNTLQIVDVAKLKETPELDKADDPLADKIVEDPLEFPEKGTDSITITNVQSMADVEETEERGDKIIENTTNEQQNEKEVEKIAVEEPMKVDECIFRIENVVTAEEDKTDTVLVDECEKETENSRNKPETMVSEEDKTETVLLDICESDNPQNDAETMISEEEKTETVLLEDCESENPLNGAETTISEEEKTEMVLLDNCESENPQNEAETMIFEEEKTETVLLDGCETENSQQKAEATISDICVNEIASETSVAEEYSSNITQNSVQDEENNSDPAQDPQNVERVNDVPVEQEEENIVNDMNELDENRVTPDLHLIKAASDQLSPMEETQVVQTTASEDQASELGFQITNVVSGGPDDSDQVMEVGVSSDADIDDLGTFSNHLPESERGDAPEHQSNDLLGEDSSSLVESLEKLLEK